jgi:hypothetical protein
MNEETQPEEHPNADGTEYMIEDFADGIILADVNTIEDVDAIVGESSSVLFHLVGELGWVGLGSWMRLGVGKVGGNPRRSYHCP